MNSIFPPKENSEMSDRDLETYCCKVWCNNSLNAVEGRLRNLLGTRELGGCCVIMNEAMIVNTADQLKKAQMVINFLLEDSGRIERR